TVRHLAQLQVLADHRRREAGEHDPFEPHLEPVGVASGHGRNLPPGELGPRAGPARARQTRSPISNAASLRPPAHSAAPITIRAITRPAVADRSGRNERTSIAAPATPSE